MSDLQRDIEQLTDLVDTQGHLIHKGAWQRIRPLLSPAAVPVGWSIRRDGDEIRITAPKGVPGGITITPADFEDMQEIDDLPLRLLYSLAAALNAAALNAQPAASGVVCPNLTPMGECIKARIAAQQAYAAGTEAPSASSVATYNTPFPCAWRWPGKQWQDGFPTAADHYLLEVAGKVPQFAYSHRHEALPTQAPPAAVAADVARHAAVAVTYLDHAGGMPAGLSLALQRLRDALKAPSAAPLTSESTPITGESRDETLVRDAWLAESRKVRDIKDLPDLSERKERE